MLPKPSTSAPAPAPPQPNAPPLPTRRESPSLGHPSPRRVRGWGRVGTASCCKASLPGRPAVLDLCPHLLVCLQPLTLALAGFSFLSACPALCCPPWGSRPGRCHPRTQRAGRRQGPCGQQHRGAGSVGSGDRSGRGDRGRGWFPSRGGGPGGCRGGGAGDTFWNQTQVTVVQPGDAPGAPESLPSKRLTLFRALHLKSQKTLQNTPLPVQADRAQVPWAARPCLSPLPAPSPVLPRVRLENKCSVSGGHPPSTIMSQRVEKEDGNFLWPRPWWRPGHLEGSLLPSETNYPGGGDTQGPAASLTRRLGGRRLREAAGPRPGQLSRPGDLQV